jgi:hypothetical protein
VKIYKVRFLDVVGKEVAEFGFYESRSDAISRAGEVTNMISMPGTLDIREITVIEDSYKMANRPRPEKEYYEIKDSR